MAGSTLHDPAVDESHELAGFIRQAHILIGSRQSCDPPIIPTSYRSTPTESHSVRRSRGVNRSWASSRSCAYHVSMYRDESLQQLTDNVQCSHVYVTSLVSCEDLIFIILQFLYNNTKIPVSCHTFELFPCELPYFSTIPVAVILFYNPCEPWVPAGGGARGGTCPPPLEIQKYGPPQG